MGFLDTIYQQDAINIFGSLSGAFTETVTYTPYTNGVAGTPRQLQAIVYRNPPGAFPGATHADSQNVEIEIPYSPDPTIGLTSPTVNGDTFTFPRLVGSSQMVTITIHTILHQDLGTWHFQLR